MEGRRNEKKKEEKEEKGYRWRIGEREREKKKGGWRYETEERIGNGGMEKKMWMGEDKEMRD